MKLILFLTFIRVYLNITLLLIKCMVPQFILCSSIVEILSEESSSLDLSLRCSRFRTFINSTAESRTPSWVLSLKIKNWSSFLRSCSSLMTRSMSLFSKQRVTQFQLQKGISSNYLSSIILICFLSIQNLELYPPYRMLFISLTLQVALLKLSLS